METSSKKRWLYLGIGCLLIALAVLLGGFFRQGRQAEKREYPDVGLLLQERGEQNALELQRYWIQADEPERGQLENDLNEWMKETLEDYENGDLSEEEASDRMRFLQSCEVLEGESLLEWVRQKNSLDIQRKAAGLYEEAMEWFQNGKYRLSRESAAMVSEEAPEYYALAQELIRKCSEKEEEEKRLQEEQKKQQYLEALAGLCKRYETMDADTAADCEHLMEEYEDVLAQLQEMAVGNQLMQEARKKYPLEEWKLVCKQMILGRVAEGTWPAQTGYMLIESGGKIPYLVIQAGTFHSVYRWSGVMHRWESYMPPEEFGSIVYMGMDEAHKKFLYTEQDENSERYVWLALTEEGWKIEEKIESMVEEYHILWFIPAQKRIYRYNQEEISQERYQEQVQEYMGRCTNTSLPQATAESLEAALNQY